MVQPAGAAPGAALTPNYIRFLRTASFDDILNERFPEDFQLQGELDSLLYLMLRHSLLLAYATAAQRILVRRGTLSTAAFREPALVDIIGDLRPRPVRTLLRVLDVDPALRASFTRSPLPKSPKRLSSTSYARAWPTSKHDRLKSWPASLAVAWICLPTGLMPGSRTGDAPPG